jgi:Sulfotransferase family
MSGTAEKGSQLSVAGWTDKLSGLQARYPGFWIGLGNLESRVLSDRLADIRIEKPIYIAGLARSGTTILLELLSLHPQLSGHRYRDFPPILAPWFWNWFVDRAGGRDKAASERAYGDGIEVTPESPEAFEEVIWMAFFDKLHDPDVSAVLTAATGNRDFEEFYRDHIRKMLLIRGGSRYLSKGNYNVTRLAYLLKLFPDAKFVLQIRDPVWHIASLMQQHERFCREHKRDVRLQRHMSRSGHFEFGLDRRPVNSGDTSVTAEVRKLWAEGREIEGWALYWKDLYGHVADALKADDALRRATLVVNYEALCSKPEQVMTAVVAHCELPPGEIDLVAEGVRRIRHPSYYEPAFSQEEIALIETVTGPVTGRLDTLAA